jgi:hypothetical protein
MKPRNLFAGLGKGTSANVVVVYKCETLAQSIGGGWGERCWEGCSTFWGSFMTGLKITSQNVYISSPKRCVLLYSEFWTMNKVQKTNNSECHTKSSVIFQILTAPLYFLRFTESAVTNQTSQNCILHVEIIFVLSCLYFFLDDIYLSGIHATYDAYALM